MSVLTKVAYRGNDGAAMHAPLQMRGLSFSHQEDEYMKPATPRGPVQPLDSSAKQVTRCGCAYVLCVFVPLYMCMLVQMSGKLGSGIQLLFTKNI